MAKVWVLDTETKGTGANVVPLEKVLSSARSRLRAAGAAAERPRADAPLRAGRRAQRQPEPERTATALPPGHVRKKATGELGKVLAVDAQGGHRHRALAQERRQLDRAALGGLAPLAGRRLRPPPPWRYSG